MGKVYELRVLALVFCLVLSYPTLCFCGSTTPECDVEELQALAKFKAGVVGWPGDGVLWHGNDTHCCLWKGVGCNRKGRVVKLDVPEEKLEVPKENLQGFVMVAVRYSIIGSMITETVGSLLGLKYLNYLDLSGIVCEGSCTIPEVLGSMTQLQFLALPYDVQGNLPQQFGNLTSLQALILPGLDQELVVEDIRWLSSLVSMNRLDLRNAHVQRSSDLAQALGSLSHLSSLTLTGCGLDNAFLRHVCLSSTPWSNLKHLDLSYNRFSGEIPGRLQNATSLEVLNLSDNNFSSSVPMWFGNYRNLAVLSLGYNSLKGIEGGLGWLLSNKRNLRYADLAHNELAGEIFMNRSMLRSPLYGADDTGDALPQWLNNLKHLRLIRISNNQLRGELPRWLAELPVLEELDASQNQFSGSIPSSLYSMRNLRLLDLHGNRLNGTVSDALGQLSNLEGLDLSGNSLSGVVSEAHFSDLSKLAYLYLSDNRLTIELDDSWTPPFQLYSLRMSSCSLGNRFPQWLRTQKILIYLDLSNVSISDELPEWIGEMKLMSLNLSYNEIIGPLPDLPSGLYLLDLSHASIYGPLPESIGRLSSLNYFYANNNNINGFVPSFLCNMKVLRQLDLSRNHLNGSIPDCWDSPWLRRMDFSFNNLSGPIPSSIKHLNGLFSLHLNNNHLSGELPLGLSYCSALTFLDLGDNHLEGVIPTWMGTLSQMQILRLRENKIHGEIPPQICSFQLLRLLDLAGNGFTGSIPLCLGFMTGFNLEKYIATVFESDYPSSSPLLPPPAMDWYREHFIQDMKGINSDYTRTALQFVTNLDLSSNSLVGTLPEELCNLFGLRGLNLSHNRLNGTIPSKIGDMSLVESLDLSDNLLSGKIPPSISALTSLEHLNLSHNNLSGEIPKGSQMQTLGDPSIYVGNPLLCADFLPRKCHSTAPVPQSLLGHPGQEDDHDNEDNLERMLFYTIVALGFGCGFWGAVGSLVLNNKWRQAYFEFTGRVTDRAYVAVAVKTAKIRRRLRNSS